MEERDREYLDLLLRPIRVCASYKPKLGHGAKAAYGIAEFQTLYGADPFYTWIGLDDPLMYAAHKAAGGMTSIYRQIGIGCEALFRRLLVDQLGLSAESARWSYRIPGPAGTDRELKLDGRIPIAEVVSQSARKRLTDWLARASDSLGVDRRVRQSLQGIVFEIRQGYKSKDSKRQNADIANAATAYAHGYLPCAGILSLQIDSDVAYRYRSHHWVLLTGLLDPATDLESIYVFIRNVLEYDLAAFFVRNSELLRLEVHQVLVQLLSPEA